jgi:hypothetical protein
MEEQSETFVESLLGISKENYGESYNQHLLEQYKIFLTLIDKISDRRVSANTFFLTVNTGLAAAIGVLRIDFKEVSIFLTLIGGISVIVLCYSWYRIIRSYRDLNKAKFKVIHEIEKLLPLRPYDAEWIALGKGENKNLYLPFTHIEIIVPWIFIILYIALVFYGLYQKTGNA